MNLSRQVFRHLRRIQQSPLILPLAVPHKSIFALAVAAGILGALATLAFRGAVEAVQWMVTGRHDSLVDMARALPAWARVALPCLGGLLAGILLWIQARQKSAAFFDYMDAVSRGDGRIESKASLLKCASSLCTIASGGSIGREGAMIQLAALSASLFSALLRLDSHTVRTVVACGAAAGVTSAYDAPLAGAVFICEILWGSISAERLVPVLVASVVSHLVTSNLVGQHPPYMLPAFPALQVRDAVWFLPLGLIAGLCAPVFLQLLELARLGFAKTRLAPPAALALGGLGVGLLSLYVPDVWGNGYEVVNAILHGQWSWQALLVILLFKIIATCLTTGSGAVGGIFTPSIFVGAVLGCLYGTLLQMIGLNHAISPQGYAVIGMGAFLAASSRAPLMSILIIVEMTSNEQIIIALGLACAIAHLASRQFGSKSMYALISRREHAQGSLNTLGGSLVRDVIKPAQTVVRKDADMGALLQMFTRFSVKHVYVVDGHERLLGEVALKDIVAWFSADEISGSPNDSRLRSPIAGHLIQQRLQLLYPDMPVSMALSYFMQHQGERLPVVASAADPVLLGIVEKSSILDIYVKKTAILI